MMMTTIKVLMRRITARRMNIMGERFVGRLVRQYSGDHSRTNKYVYRNNEQKVTSGNPNHFSPHSHIPYDKEGYGFYSNNNIASFKSNNAAMPLVLEAVQSTVIKSGSVFTIVDYGTADGGTSMPLIYSCVKAIREKYGEELPINVIYEDQPVNDFKSLFMRVHGLIPGPPNFFLDFPNVFVMASGTNFFSQCFPSESVTLGFSASAMHWLRDKPCDLKNEIFPILTTARDEKEKFSDQAAKDWEMILMNRAIEMMPGSTLVLVELAVDEHGQFSGHTNEARVCLISLLRDLWKGLSSDGVITLEEFEQTNIISYYRTVEELKKPFQSKDSPVRQAGLELVSIETRVFSCPFRQKWVRENGSDSEKHAKEYVKSFRTWTNSSFMSGLSDSRSSEEKTKIVDEFYRRYEAEVAKQPEDYGGGRVQAYLVIKKRL